MSTVLIRVRYTGAHLVIINSESRSVCTSFAFMCTSLFYSKDTAKHFLKVVTEKGPCGQDAVVLELVFESKQNDG